MIVARTQPSRFALFFIGTLVLLFGYLLLSIGVAEHNETSQYEKFGLHAPAKLIGYKYVKNSSRGSPAGDRPVLSYIAGDGVERQLIAYEYGPASNSKKKELQNQEIKITYLSNNPDIACVDEWHKLSSGMMYITLGILATIFSFALIYSGAKTNSAQ